MVAKSAKQHPALLLRQFISVYSKIVVWIDYFDNGCQWLSLDVAGRSTARRACWSRAGRRLSAGGGEGAGHPDQPAPVATVTRLCGVRGAGLKIPARMSDILTLVHYCYNYYRPTN